MEDPPVIDTDSDLNRSEDDADRDSGQQISDCDSEPSDKAQAAYLKSETVSTINLSAYVLVSVIAAIVLMHRHSVVFLTQGSCLYMNLPGIFLIQYILQGWGQIFFVCVFVYVDAKNAHWCLGTKPYRWCI